MYYFCLSTDPVRRDFRKEPDFWFTWPGVGVPNSGAGASAAKANARMQK